MITDVTIQLSTVTPVYRGAEHLDGLVAAIAAIRAELELSEAPVRLGEAIFVADNPVDDSEAVLRRLADKHPWVHVLVLSRNFGQHPATIAGILHSSGHWVVTLDEDLQHHPGHMLEMLREAVRHQADVVYARPTAPVHGATWRDSSSRWLKRILGKITDNPMIPLFNSYRLMRGSIARAAAGVCGHETYFDIALSWFTTHVRAKDVPMKDDRYIETGQSGYNLARLLSHTRRLLVSSQARVLRFGVLVGLLALAISTTGGIYVLVSKLLMMDDDPVRGWASTMLTVLLFGGLTLVLLGVIVEYLASVLLHTQGKPVFFTVDRSLDAPVWAWFEGEESSR